MKLSDLKLVLDKVDDLTFVLPGGNEVPRHFHVTEVGLLQKHFIDCGGTVRKESVINMQLYTANDFDHRLSPKKLGAIIQQSEKALQLPDLEIEVEYQADTIGKYGLAFDNLAFHLVSKHTDCLAKDQCGLPVAKPKIRLSTLSSQYSCCTPGSGCC